MRPAIPLEQHLASLQAYWKRHRAFPSMSRLAPVLGLASAGGVQKALRRLTEAGWLNPIPGGRVAPTKRFFERPVVGTVRAGLPQTVDDATEHTALAIDDYLIDHPERTSLVRVRGDSMRDAGLLEGDLVAVDSGAKASAGDIVVAVVDGQVTVKYLRPDADGGWQLSPAHDDYPVIKPTTDLDVLGVVVGVVRRIRRAA